MKKLVIMAGLPASGKSYYRSRFYGDMEFVDSDEIKEAIPTYDPKNPQAVHAMSKAIEKHEIYERFVNGVSFVYDTTASNLDKVIKMTKEAQGLGYIVEICYIEVPLHVALKRNKERERVVPESVIYEKASLIKTSMEVAKQYVDYFIKIDGGK